MRIVVEVRGGLVQEISSDTPLDSGVEIVVVDWDTEGTEDDERLSRWQDPRFPQDEESLGFVAGWVTEVDPAWVESAFKQVEGGGGEQLAKL